MNKKVFWILFLISNVCAGQVVNDTIYSFNENGYLKWTTDGYVEQYEIFYPEEFNLKQYELVSVNKKMFFVQYAGGIVYQLDNKNLTRIDKSYNHKTTLYSDIFVYKNKIFKYGGYGMWKSNDVLSFFDDVENEWKIVDVNRQFVPKGIYDFSSEIILNDYYAFSGYFNTVQDPYEISLNRDIYSFNFDKLEWKHLGKSLFDVRIRKLLNLGNSSIFTDGVNYYELDIEKNLYFVLNDEIDKNLFNSISKTQAYYFDSKLYFLDKRNNIIESDFNIEKYRIGNSKIIYKESLSTIIIIISIVTVLLIFVIYKLNYNNKIVLNQDKMSYKNMNIKLTSEEITILKEFKKNNTISNNIVYEICQNKILDRTQNLRNKNKIIESLNIKLQVILNSNKDVIKLKKSNQDKRMYELVFNEKYYSVIDKL